jgi:hypothetical protein
MLGERCLNFANDLMVMRRIRHTFLYPPFVLSSFGYVPFFFLLARIFVLCFFQLL